MAEQPKKPRRGAPEEPAGGSDPFVVQFTALTMIMLAFFILLNSLSTIDERRKKLALGSLTGSFGILPDGMGMDEKGEYAPSEHPILAGVPREAFLKMMGSMFRGATATGKVRIFTDRTRVVLAFDADFLFPPGVSQVNPAAFAALDEVGRAVRILRLPVRVEGHTDSTPGLGPLDNWRISAQRSISVVRYLREGCGVEAELLSAVGYADTRPPAGTDPADQAVRRRVEVVFDGALEVTHGR